MPFKVYCHGCRVVLHEGENMKAPYEIIEDFEGRCPNCRVTENYLTLQKLLK